ncbi:UNVERIFIED_CONTAM: hypothetical protein FKN15_048621 [Acipenser sinensis]
MEFRRRRCCCPVARVTGMLLLSVLVFRGVCSAGEEWNMTLSVPRSVKCPVGRDCILNCTFNYRAGGGGGGGGGWDERVTGMLLLSVLVFRGVCSAGEEWNMTLSVPRSVKCPVGRDCILNCTFNYRAGGGGGGGGGWDERLTPPEGAQPVLTCVLGSLHQREPNLYSPVF